MNAAPSLPMQADAFEGLSGNAALEALLAETAALFHRLRSEAQELHGGGDGSSGRRSVLLSLRRRGPQSVPALARARPVSRQYMQTLVNALLEAGLAEQAHNPAHKRSPLIAITPTGESLLERMTGREREAFSATRLELDRAELEQAARTLRQVRAFFGSQQWRAARERLANEEKS